MWPLKLHWENRLLTRRRSQLNTNHPTWSSNGREQGSKSTKAPIDSFLWQVPSGKKTTPWHTGHSCSRLWKSWESGLSFQNDVFSILVGHVLLPRGDTGDSKERLLTVTLISENSQLVTLVRQHSPFKRLTFENFNWSIEKVTGVSKHRLRSDSASVSVLDHENDLKHTNHYRKCWLDQKRTTKYAFRCQWTKAGGHSNVVLGR